MTTENELQNYIESKQRYVKFENDGDTKELFYLGYAQGPVPEKFLKKDKDGKEIPETTIMYTFRTKNGFTQTWTQGNPKVAAEFVKLSKGTFVSITKIEKGKYFIRKIAGAKMPAAVDGAGDETVPF